MSVNEEQFGSLYSDERDKPLLSPTAQKKFEEYQNKLANLSKIIRENEGNEVSPWQEWENGLRQIYKEMIYDAFDALGVEMPKDMEVHFAGSLAKAQATEYSDLDAFVIVKNDEDIKKVKPVFDALNNLCQRIFTASNQIYPDPIGINPSRLIGTPDDLFGMLKDGMVADVEATAMSILTSKPVLPRYELGEELRD
ncbi:DrrA [Legionella pneumophila subsp. pneumophila]